MSDRRRARPSEIVAYPKPSFPDFVGWLRTRDPRERYNWHNPKTCLCARYAEARGRTYLEVWLVKAPGGQRINTIALGAGMSPAGWTVGAALARCEAIMENRRG